MQYINNESEYETRVRYQEERLFICEKLLQFENMEIMRIKKR
uniref:Uncharacterized protein n=1 Tax=Octopus bimaculoides TaxID=37653 RepID=A0A0L8H112_OCTBM